MLFFCGNIVIWDHIIYNRNYSLYAFPYFHRHSKKNDACGNNQIQGGRSRTALVRPGCFIARRLRTANTATKIHSGSWNLKHYSINHLLDRAFPFNNVVMSDRPEWTQNHSCTPTCRAILWRGSVLKVTDPACVEPLPNAKRRSKIAGTALLSTFPSSYLTLFISTLRMSLVSNW